MTESYHVIVIGGSATAYFLAVGQFDGSPSGVEYPHSVAPSTIFSCHF